MLSIDCCSSLDLETMQAKPLQQKHKEQHKKKTQVCIDSIKSIH